MDHTVTGGSLTSVESDAEENSLWRHLFSGLSGGSSGARQLQHRRVLTLAEISDQHDLSIRELERIVVHCRVLVVDLAEARHFVRQFIGGQKREPSVAFDFFFKCKFCPWQQADGKPKFWVSRFRPLFWCRQIQ
jgi:hypothetical protein